MTGQYLERGGQEGDSAVEAQGNLSGDIEALNSVIETTPQSLGAEIYTHPVVLDAHCVIGTSDQLTPAQRNLVITFSADVYDLLDYTTEEGRDKLIESDTRTMAAACSGCVSPEKRVKHVILFGNQGQILAYVRMIPARGDLDVPFDPNAFPTGDLFENIKFGFEEERPCLTNREVFELSRLTGVGAGHAMAKGLLRDVAYGTADQEAVDKVKGFLRKYLPEHEYQRYEEKFEKARSAGRVTRSIKESVFRPKDKLQRQLQMMLFMLAINSHLEGLPVIELIGNLDGQIAGAFLNDRGGIQAERGTGQIKWDSPDITDVFYPYMSAHEAEVTPFHFGTRHAINNATGRAGDIMRGARRFLQREMIDESLLLSP